MTLFERRYKLFCVVVTLLFKLVNIPLLHRLSCLLEGLDVKLLKRDNFHTVLILPTAQNLVVSGTVDLSLIANGELTALIDNCLLFRTNNC